MQKVRRLAILFMTMNQKILKIIQMMRREINQTMRRKIRIETTNRMRRRAKEMMMMMMMMMTMEDGGQVQSVSKK